MHGKPSETLVNPIAVSPSPPPGTADSNASKRSVKLPKSMKLQYGEPNAKQLAQDGPIRRKIQTSSTKNRGSSQLFAVYPNRVDIGTLKQGTTHRSVITLTNSGVDTGRFIVKGVPNQKGVKVAFPIGPVAPGISVKLEVEIKALEVGDFQEEFRIETEAEIFRIPISATIVSQ